MKDCLIRDPREIQDPARARVSTMETDAVFSEISLTEAMMFSEAVAHETTEATRNVLLRPRFRCVASSSPIYIIRETLEPPPHAIAIGFEVDIGLRKEDKRASALATRSTTCSGSSRRLLIAAPRRASLDAVVNAAELAAGRERAHAVYSEAVRVREDVEVLGPDAAPRQSFGKGDELAVTAHQEVVLDREAGNALTHQGLDLVDDTGGRLEAQLGAPMYVPDDGLDIPGVTERAGAARCRDRGDVRLERPRFRAAVAVDRQAVEIIDHEATGPACGRCGAPTRLAGCRRRATGLRRGAEAAPQPRRE